MFTQGGSSTNPNVTFISAADSTQAGSYDVNVTQAATQATLDRAERHVADRRRLDDRGERRLNQITYEVKATDTQADVVNGLNAAFANAGPRARATRRTAPASRSTRSATATTRVRRRVGRHELHRRSPAPTSPERSTAIAATGQRPAAAGPVRTPGVGGLALNITGTTLGDLGTFTYSPGIAQRVSTAVTTATDAVTGYITTSQNDLNNQIKSFNSTSPTWRPQIAQYQATAAERVHNMEIGHRRTEGTGNTLTSALAELPSFG